MFHGMNAGRIQTIIAAGLLGAFLVSCTNGLISREDMYWMASTSPEIRLTSNDVEIPDGTGSFDFGFTDVDTTLTSTFTIHNDGEQTLFISGTALYSGDTNHFDLDLSGLSSHIEPGAGSSFSISFHPMDTGLLAATVVIHNNDLDESSYTFEITGEGTGTASPQPDIQVLLGEVEIYSGAEGHDFGSVEQGYASMPVVFTVRNLGTAGLTLNGVSVNDADNFAVDDGSLKAVLAPGEGTWFSVTFTPTVAGDRSSTISIDNDDPDESLFTFTVTGTGSTDAVPDIAVSYTGRYVPSGTGRYEFGTVEVWEKSAQVTFTLRNTGTAALEVNSVQLSDASQFTLVPNDPSKPPPFVLEPEGSTSFTMTFEPTMSGGMTDMVEIATNDPDTVENPYTFTVTGTGSTDPVPDIHLRVRTTWHPPGSWYDFGALKIGQKSSEKFTIENPGTANLEITNILLTEGDQEDFTLDLTKTSFTVPAGGTTDFTAIFTPTRSGERTRMLDIHSDDPDVTPYTVGLKGFGQ